MISCGIWVQLGSGPSSSFIYFYVFLVYNMKNPELRKTIKTYKDWELEHMLSIAEWCENSTKVRIIQKELERRKQDDYVDETLDERVSIKARLPSDKKAKK